MQFPDLQLQHKAAQFITKNASGLLTAGGVIGVGVTAVLTARATIKAHGIIREKVAIRQANYEALEGEAPLPPDLTKTEIAQAVWPHYVPPAIAGVATIASIIMANRMSAKRAAALAAAYSISETRLQEYKDKVAEKFGKNKARSVRDDLAQDQVTNNPPSKEVIILGSGDVLCFEPLTGRYFTSSVEIIKRAENAIHEELFQTHSASLSEFFDKIGLESTTFSDMMGWNNVHDDLVTISFTTTLTPDNRPCLVLNYSQVPGPDFHRLY